MQQKEQTVGAMTKSIGIVMLLTMVGKITGFLREIIFANYFGTGAVSDAYKNALLVPGFILSILIAAVAAAMIPILSEERRQSEKQANRFVSNLLTVGSFVSVCVLLLTLLFLRPIIIGIFLPYATEETQSIAITLSTIMLSMELFVFLGRILTAYLQAHFHFTMPVLTQIVQNLVLLVVIVVVGKQGNIEWVAFGTVISWLMQFLVQIPSARRMGLRYRPRFDLSDKALRATALLTLPAIIPTAFDSFYLIFAHSIASQNIGHISALDYSNRLSTMISAALLTTVATVLYPSLVDESDNRKKFTDSLSYGININFLIAIPASAALILLAQPIIRLVYERGQFTAESTALTSGTLACFSFGILGIGLRDICNRCFYAYKAKTIPLIIGIVSLALNMLLNYALYPLYGPAGIAASISITSLLTGVALLVLLHYSKKVVDWRTLSRCLCKVCLATLVMSLLLVLCTQLFSLQTSAGKGFALSMVFVIGLGIVVYLFMLWVLKTEELHTIVNSLKRKLKKG